MLFSFVWMYTYAHVFSPAHSYHHPFCSVFTELFGTPTCFIHSLHFGPLQPVLFGIQDSAQVLSPVRSMLLSTQSQHSSQYILGDLHDYF